MSLLPMEAMQWNKQKCKIKMQHQIKFKEEYCQSVDTTSTNYLDMQGFK
jgi:hypothetical protein